MIPMRDGKCLSADLIRPEAEGRYPLIVEYHPYRKRPRLCEKSKTSLI